MRQIMKLFITSFLFILFSGCTKDVYDPSDKIPGEGTNPFSKVTISSNFDWSMIQISHLTVQSFDPYDGTYNYLVEVTTVQRNYPIGSVDLNRNHSSDVLV